MTEVRPVRRALLAVYDKTGVVELARGLAALGVQLVSSGGDGRDAARGRDVRECDRQVAGLERLPRLLLVTFPVEPLVRGLAIEQPDADDRDPQRACRLQQLAGDRAEPTGEDRQAVGQREFRREVRDLYRLRPVGDQNHGLSSPPVMIEVVGHVDQQAQEVGVIEDRGDARGVE